MSNNSAFMRGVLDSLLPGGSAFKPVPDGDLDRLFDGMSDNYQAVIDDLGDLAYIRDPWKCPSALLPDLERDFGISPNENLTEAERRGNLFITTSKKRYGIMTAYRLQKALDIAGFGAGGYGLTVIKNSNPPLNPALFIGVSYTFSAEELANHPGNPATQIVGYYLVNGDRYVLSPIYPQAGNFCARSFDGSDTKSPETRAGYYKSYSTSTDSYVSPTSEYWPMIFFIGGGMTRNFDGSIVIKPVWVPRQRRQELHRLILRIRPLGIWAGMIVQYY